MSTMSVPPMTAPQEQDPCSGSNMLEVGVTHVHLKWNLDFKNQQIGGSAKLDLQFWKDADKLVLDGRDLSVKEVRDCDGLPLQFGVENHSFGAFGQKITIKLRTPGKAGNKTNLTVFYTTSTRATALQWLSAEQTADGKQHFLFSQCQAIHARSILPCMDAPAAKFTYTAEVTAPSALTVLMSAVAQSAEQQADELKLSKFEQKVPISSYLLAVSAGALEKRDLSPRIAVYAEPSVVDKAAYDFADSEKMLTALEGLLGPYVWGRYDMLVLPPSFPYGGMENPCMTFVTPTLLTGDRSQANVIAHEMAHSWTGNLVTNATWQHFWLNEGNTHFIEEKVAALLYGEPHRQFAAYNSYHTVLYQTVHTQFSPKDPMTQLVLPCLNEIDPDDAYSSIAYMKGSTFLMHVEEAVGGPVVFDKFLRAYIDEFKYGTVNTVQWQAFVQKYFGSKVAAVDFKTWLYEPGMGPVEPKFDMSLVNACVSVSERWVQADENTVNDIDAQDYALLSADQKVEVLCQLLKQDKIAPYKLEAMDKLYKLSESPSYEIASHWIQLCLKSHWSGVMGATKRVLTDQGRMKYLRPIYRALYAWPEQRQFAIDLFKATRSKMHEIAATMVAKDLHVDK